MAALLAHGVAPAGTAAVRPILDRLKVYGVVAALRLRLDEEVQSPDGDELFTLVLD